jgi:ribonuclease HI
MIRIYTDGSVKTMIKGDKESIVVGWGYTAISEDGIEIRYDCGKLSEPKDFITQRNVAGEMAAVIDAVQWAMSRDIGEIEVISDYAGCKQWADGGWETKNKYTQDYAEYINTARDFMKINFRSIKGHWKNESKEDNRWNDRADELAKMGVSLKK